MCHQTVSLVARHLESNGIPALIIGSALDIVESSNVPRYLHVDFPLGNPCGKPNDKPMQAAILQQALAWLGDASPHTWLARAPQRWSDDQRWRANYSKVDDSNREALRLRGEERRQQQKADKAKGETRASMIAES